MGKIQDVMKTVRGKDKKQHDPHTGMVCTHSHTMTPAAIKDKPRCETERYAKRYEGGER